MKRFLYTKKYLSSIVVLAIFIFSSIYFFNTLFSPATDDGHIQTAQAIQYCREFRWEETGVSQGSAYAATGGDPVVSVKPDFRVPAHIKQTTAAHTGNFSSSVGDGHLAMRNWIQTNGCAGYHVCTIDEINLYSQYHNIYDDEIMNGPMIGAFNWVNAGAHQNLSSTWTNNCNNWRSNSSTVQGLRFSTFADWTASSGNCDQSYRVLCCL